MQGRKTGCIRELFILGMAIRVFITIQVFFERAVIARNQSQHLLGIALFRL